MSVGGKAKRSSNALGWAFGSCAAATLLCGCRPHSDNVVQQLSPGETPGDIAPVGPDTYRLHVSDVPTGLNFDVADTEAITRAREYCTRMKKTMVVKDKVAQIGYGYALTWSCVPAQDAPI